MGRLVETCPSCGEYNRAQMPFYGWIIGGLIVLALMLALGDPAAVIRVVGDIIHARSAPSEPAG